METIKEQAFGEDKLVLEISHNNRYPGYDECSTIELMYLENAGNDTWNVWHTEYFRLTEMVDAVAAFEERAASKNPVTPSSYQRPLDCVIHPYRIEPLVLDTPRGFRLFETGSAKWVYEKQGGEHDLVTEVFKAKVFYGDPKKVVDEIGFHMFKLLRAEPVKG